MCVRRTNINVITISDHALVLIEIFWGQWIWALNKSLLQDVGVTAMLERELAAFFENNLLEETPPLSMWEAYKCHIGGILIAQGTRCKKERTQQIDALLPCIKRLETQHKKIISKTGSGGTSFKQENLNSLLLRRAYYTLGGPGTSMGTSPERCWQMHSENRGYTPLCTKLLVKRGNLSTHLETALGHFMRRYTRPHMTNKTEQRILNREKWSMLLIQAYPDFLQK